jgi:hypothetical protein
MEEENTFLNLAEHVAESVLKKTFNRYGVFFPLNLQAVCKVSVSLSFMSIYPSNFFIAFSKGKVMYQSKQ